MTEHEHKKVGRRLHGGVTLWQDWGDESVEAEVTYWELFTDLLMVAAASSLAEGFQSNQTWTGFLEFALLYSTIAHGWLLYTHHFTSRFIESSLVHSCILFFYLLGMALTIVNASVETAQFFSLGVVLQRVAFLVMMGQVAWTLPRARFFAGVLITMVSITVVLFLVTAIFTYNSHSLTRYVWIASAAVDLCTELPMLFFLSGRQLVPVNIEHSKDRLGVLVLVMMGETVISASVAYREYMEEGLGRIETQNLYIVLVFSFLLVFMFTLLFFNMQPHPKDHAFRRSRVAGLGCLVLNKILGMTLLLVGVYIKLAVDSVAEGDLLDEFSQPLLNHAVGSSMIVLLGMRCCHYAGVCLKISAALAISTFQFFLSATHSMRFLPILPVSSFYRNYRINPTLQM
mmetsp:Transcript_23454/g.48691  ORF Transcript_23454/g.48691 Transcript_23454/m.48691 type:complete len:400 (+) Transcript_23454:194-1393(+)